MSKNGLEHHLKCFVLTQNLELISTGDIKNLEVGNPAFIEEFEKSFDINNNVLICNE